MMNMLCLLDQKLEITFSMSADVYSDLTIGLALKNYHKMGLICQNPSTGSKDTVKSIFVSADVYSDLASGEAYSKKTLKFLKSVE